MCSRCCCHRVAVVTGCHGILGAYLGRLRMLPNIPYLLERTAWSGAPLLGCLSGYDGGFHGRGLKKYLMTIACFVPMVEEMCFYCKLLINVMKLK